MLMLVQSPPCIQEEADTRLLLHVAATNTAGRRRVILGTRDSDVVVCVSTLWPSNSRLVNSGLRLECVRFIPVHEIVRELG